MRLELERRGLLPEPISDEMRKRFDEALERPDPPVSVIVDCAPYADTKRRAAAMHRSQFGENSMFARIPEDLRAEFYRHERFFQARPEGAAPTGEPRTDFA
jgi:LmbE family N-acetylglucosaminyl deacetylase